MKLFCGGAGREVGRSHIIIDHDGLRFGMDAGVKILEDRSVEFPILQDNLKFLILSHAHLDHSGYVPVLNNIPIFLTKPTLLEADVMWKDYIKVAKLNNRKPDYNIKDLEKVKKNVEILDYNVWNSIYGVKILPIRAGHLLGAASTYIEIKDKKIIYTGDFKYIDTELIQKAKDPPKADILIIESTYWYQDHTDRRLQIEKIFEVVDNTIDNGGVALFPSFALGRTQELISILVDKYKDRVPIYVDGMGKLINKVYLSYKDDLKDKSFDKKLKYVKEVDRVKRHKITDKPGIIVSSSGMLEGGPAIHYLFNLNRKSSVILTGYQVKTSNGYRLLNYGKIKLDNTELKVDLPVYHFNLSAHADRKDILAYINKVSPEKIILVHSDSSDIFEEELRSELGYDAVAIGTGQWLEL